MAGKRLKHPDSLAFRRAGRYRPLRLVGNGDEHITPTCPDGASEDAKAAWATLWQSPLRGAIAETDIPALSRWIWWYDAWREAAEEISCYGPTRQGSRQDLVLRPAVRFLRICEAALGDLEEAFGMTPLARMRLGITFGEEQSPVLKLRQPAEPQPFDPQSSYDECQGRKIIDG
jgi:P27 family predicted phage terminase small subunit